MKSLTYKPFLDEANAYYKTANKGFESKKLKYNVLQGLVTISLEKFCMALLGSKGIMPNGHTMEELYEEIALSFDVNESLKDEFIFADSFQQLCSFEPSIEKKIKDNDMERMIKLLKKIKSLADSNIKD
jgi:HEPN domain-containing protein